MLTNVEREDIERELLNLEADYYEDLKASQYLSPDDAADAAAADRDARWTEYAEDDTDKQEVIASPTFAQKVALMLRERAIYDRVYAETKSPDKVRAAIVADRLERWTEHLANMTGDAETVTKLTFWATAMAKRHGIPANKKAGTPEVQQPICAMHGIPMPWLMALLVLQYGESEYFWPTAWGPLDVKRAELWISGAKPATAVKGFTSLPLPTE